MDDSNMTNEEVIAAGKKNGTQADENDVSPTKEEVKDSNPEDDKGIQIFTYENAIYFLVFALVIQLFMTVGNKIGLEASLMIWHFLCAFGYGMVVRNQLILKVSPTVIEGYEGTQGEPEIGWYFYFNMLDGFVHVFLITMIHRIFGKENFVVVQQDCIYAAIGEFYLCAKTVGLIFYQIYVYFTDKFMFIKVIHTSHHPTTGEPIDNNLTPSNTKLF
jgi:hypothetical protein